MSDEDGFLTEAEATRLWRRAAQLQAEEARRAEARAAAEAGESPEASGGSRTDGYALAHVRTAALEAGIGERFVAAALAEVQTDRVIRQASGTRTRRIARWVLGNPAEALTVRRLVHAGPGEVLAAMEALLPHEPYVLTLRDRMGDPTAGGTLVFDIQNVGFAAASKPGFVGDASYADLRQVYATLTPVPGESEHTEVTLRGPMVWAFGINAAVSGAMTLMSGGISMLIATGVGLGLGALGPVGMGLLVAAAGGAGGAGGMSGFRALYRYGRRRGTRGLEALLAAVAARAEGGWGIAPPGPAPTPTPPPR